MALRSGLLLGKPWLTDAAARRPLARGDPDLPAGGGRKRVACRRLHGGAGRRFRRWRRDRPQIDLAGFSTAFERFKAFVLSEAR